MTKGKGKFSLILDFTTGPDLSPGFGCAFLPAYELRALQRTLKVYAKIPISLFSVILHVRPKGTFLGQGHETQGPSIQVS